MLKEDFVIQSNMRRMVIRTNIDYSKMDFGHGQAILELMKALRINPNYLLARINLGVLYEDQKRWKEARKEYRKILQITPDDEHIRKRLEKIS
jgi:tetratricopeptide (TPR) repeat protein